MHTIELIVTVADDGTIQLKAPAGIRPGAYQGVLILDDQPSVKESLTTRDLLLLDVGEWPQDFSLSRENLYDEWGR
jgi:hypothetical protein